jgi:hypothetical protein
MKQGVYRICEVKHGADDTEMIRHIGRIVIINGHTQVLEDAKDGRLGRIFPDGLIDDQKQNRWHSLTTSPYFRVSAEGLIGEDPKEMEQPEVRPEEMFDLVDAVGEKKILESYGENLFMDGKRMTPEEVQKLQEDIRQGKQHLLPRVQQ